MISKNKNLSDLLNLGRELTLKSGFCNVNRNYSGNYALCRDNEGNLYNIQYVELRTNKGSVLNYNKLIIRKKDLQGEVSVFAIDHDAFNGGYNQYNPDQISLEDELNLSILKVDEEMQRKFESYDFFPKKSNVVELDNYRKIA